LTTSAELLRWYDVSLRKKKTPSDFALFSADGWNESLGLTAPRALAVVGHSGQQLILHRDAMRTAKRYGVAVLRIMLGYLIILGSQFSFYFCV
jgi:uncharacterized membrane protein YphA (DoxX/SURF4 family)